MLEGDISTLAAFGYIFQQVSSESHMDQARSGCGSFENKPFTFITNGDITNYGSYSYKLRSGVLCRIEGGFDTELNPT